jgi:hypothetical protein
LARHALALSAGEGALVTRVGYPTFFHNHPTPTLLYSPFYVI